VSGGRYLLLLAARTGPPMPVAATLVAVIGV
jgi:hypothetical protein